MRSLKPAGSTSHARWCRYTRMEFMPMDSAHPNSRLMVAVSNDSACHISNWLMAVLGMKSLPRSQPHWAYQALACSFVHTSRTVFTVSAAIVSAGFSFFAQDSRASAIQNERKGMVLKVCFMLNDSLIKYDIDACNIS